MGRKGGKKKCDVRHYSTISFHLVLCRSYPVYVCVYEYKRGIRAAPLSRSVVISLALIALLYI